MTKRKPKTALELLKILEWSGTARGQGTGMGFDNGNDYACCPVCGGLRDEVNEFMEEAWGHRKTCALKRILLEGN